MSFQLIKNKERKQYEFHVDGKVAKIEYILASGSIYLTHTEVPGSLQGRGIASSLIKAPLEDIKFDNWKLVPLCPVVAGYLKKHPEWKELVLKGINIA